MSAQRDPAAAPLTVLSAWFRALAVSARLNIAAHLIPIMKVADGLTFELMEEACLAWIEQPLDVQLQLGRAVQACALLDFVMETEGCATAWDERIERSLDALEIADTAQDKTVINRGLPYLQNLKRECIAAAVEWRELRYSTLSNAALRGWMERVFRELIQQVVSAKGGWE